MKRFDTHVHLTDMALTAGGRLAEALLGAEAFLCCATSLADSRAVVSLAAREAKVFAAVGVHPAFCDEQALPHLQESLEDILRVQPERIRAVGEIGLDHHWPVPRQEQYDLFEAQLQLAKELDLPVSVHDREAHAEMYELLRKYKPRGALHCYSGSADDAAWLVEQGMYLGFGGAVTYKGAKRAARVLAAIPHDRALLETDCPYMAPEPVRGTRNDSRNIVHVAAYIGTLWDMKK